MNIDKKTLKAILSERLKDDPFKTMQDLPSPFLFKDAKKAAQIIIDGMKTKQKILIAADYDVDGISACAIMLRFFQMIDYQNISHIIPNRFNDGYGINKEMIEKNPADIVITVDNGVSAFEVGKYCKENNIKFIITDHHKLEETLPLTDAIINPQQTDCTFPQKKICGASIAWYLCNAIKIEMGLNFSLAPLLDLVAIATIADVMPLVKVNRLLVKSGLSKFSESSLPANKILKNSLKNKTINAQNVSFNIVPLINSAGRIKDGNLALRFLLAKSESEAQELYNELQVFNQNRKDIAKAVLELAKKNAKITQNCVITYGEDWHQGVLGIVASNLCGLYKKPVIVLTQQGDILKGSGRSLGTINLLKYIQKHSELLERCGGHSQAIGLELKKENLEAFFEALQNEAMPETEKEDDEFLGVLDIKEIDEDFLSIIESFEPYGKENPEPVFECKNLEISSIKLVKGVHQRVEFKGSKVSGINFFFEKAFSKNDRVDIVFSLQRNNFDKQPSMVIKSICPS